MITANECIQMLFNKFPGYSKSWDEHFEYWGIDPATSYTYMNVFTDYVIPILEKNNNPILIKDIFEFTEKLLEDGDDNVVGAVTTSFLENIINNSDRGKFSPLTFTRLLGRKSKLFCKSWDEFSGVKTLGLWDEEKS